MPFTIETKDGPNLVNPANAKAADRREAAIAKFLQPGNTQAQESPVRNPSQISPEESSAVLPKQEPKTEFEKALEASKTDEEGQSTTSEADSSPEQAPKEATDKTEEEEQPLSKQYAIIARKEKALRMKMQEIKAKEAELLSREQALKSPQQSQVDESKFISLEKLQSDPVSTLLRAGVSYDQITQMIMNQPQVDPATRAMMDELKAEIQALKGEQENSKKSAAEQQTQAYQNALKQIEREASSLIHNDPAFETIKATGSVSDVVQLIEDTFKADGILLSVEDAAREVEEYLVNEAIKLAELKKVKQRLAPPKKEEPKQEIKAQPQQNQMKTLTNAVGTTRQLSAKERAILAFKGELNK
jgi:hypothetical protein